MPAPPAFKIVVYESLAPAETPETARYIAGLFIGYDAHARWVLSGPTAVAARTKMEAFWAKERKSYEPREAPRRKEASEAVDVVEDPGDVI